MLLFSMVRLPLAVMGGGQFPFCYSLIWSGSRLASSPADRNHGLRLDYRWTVARHTMPCIITRQASPRRLDITDLDIKGPRQQLDRCTWAFGGCDVPVLRRDGHMVG